MSSRSIKDVAGLAGQVSEVLRGTGQTLCCAESCTGGLLSSSLVALPGSSDVFVGAVVSYSNASKTALLGVPPELLERHGAVSEACAKAMAEGCRRAFGADLAVAVSGIAGPSGGSAEKPVGLVWLAICTAAGAVTRRELFPNLGRDHVRNAAVASALELVLASAKTILAGDV